MPNFSVRRPSGPLGHSGGPGPTQLRARGFASSHFQEGGGGVKKESGAKPAGSLLRRSQRFPAHLPPSSGR